MLMGVSAAWLGNLEVALSTIGFCGLNFLPIVPTYDSPARLAAFAMRAMSLSAMQEVRPWRLKDVWPEYGEYHDQM